MGEEFDEAKAEIEKLRADLKLKTELADNLRKAHGEQLIRTQEACSKIEKLARELNGKEEEISKAKGMCEDFQSSLHEKESVIRRLSTANDKLRVDSGEKYKKWEEEKRGLVLALDEANEKNIDQEQKINVFMAEIEGLKGLLSASQKKCLEAEKNAKASIEMRKRDAMLLKLEEESRIVENQLKWKKEQFSHLEEAHEKLRDQFKESKKGWEMEKSTLIDEICSLQSRLDSQTRILEDLERRFKMCNEALAREESRRKHLEVEVSEYKARFENVFTECQDAKSQLECMATQRDREIAALRHSLATKETFYKEIEYKARRLEQENQELLVSLKELQEAGIRESGNSSLGKMRNKLKSLEQMHRNCSSDLRAKEAEWSFQMKKLTEELDNYRTALESKETTVEELGMELEICHTVILQLKMQNEEASTTLLVLKSGITEAQLNIENADTEARLREKERGENVSLLMRQLETKTTALNKVMTDFEEERQKVASLLKRVEDLNFVEEQRQLLQKELERYKELLEESSRSQLCFKKQALQTETDLKDKLKAVCDDLDVANSELAKEHEKVVSLSRKAKALDLIEAKCLLMQKELEKYKEALEQSSRHQLCLEKQASQIENDSNERFREVCDAFDMASSELAEKVECLFRRVDHLELVEEQRLLMQKELERYKEMVEQSSRKQLLVEKKALDVETDLKKKLQEVYDALDTANAELAKENERTASLLTRVQSLDQIEEQSLQMQKELEKYKEMLEESSRCQHRLEKQAFQKEKDLKEKLQEVCDALDTANAELAKENEKTASLLTRVQSLDQIEEQSLQMQKELEKYKEMLEESSRCQHRLEKQAFQKEKDLKEKLQEVCDALDTANAELAKENEKTASLLTRVQSLDQIEEQSLQMQKELEKYKEMLEESSRCQHRLEKQAFQKEKDLKEKLQEVCDALDRLKSDFAAKNHEGHALEFELWMWKTIAHRLKDDLEDSQLLRKDIEASLLSQVEVEETIKQEKDDLSRLLKARDSRIDNMQHQIDFFEKELKTRESAASTSAMETVLSFESEKEGFLRTMREKDKILNDLQKEVGWLEQESLRRELEVSVLTLAEAERKFDLDKEHFIQLMEEKDQRIDELLHCVRSREQKFNGSLISLSLELAEKQAEISLVHEAWEKIASAEILAQLEIEEKKMMLTELEDDIFSVQEKLELQEKSLSESKHKALEIEAELEEKLLEMKKLENLMETKLRMSEASIDELRKGNKSLAENVMKLSSERDNLFAFFMGLGERISQFSNEDMQLMGTLACMVQSFDEDSGSSSTMLNCETELFHAVKENVNTCPSPTVKRFQSTLEERAPFRELN